MSRLANIVSEVEEIHETAAMQEEMTENTENYEEYLEERQKKKRIKKEKLEKRKNIGSYISKGIGILLFCYLSFLIYGAIITQYEYSNDGNIQPQILTLTDIKEREEFKKILNVYSEVRGLYIDAIEIDKEMAAGEIDPYTIAPKYEGKLEDVERISIKIDALKTLTQYTKIKALLLSWVQNDIALYLQNMSAAITENNEEKASNAMQDRTRMKNNLDTKIGRAHV